MKTIQIILFAIICFSCNRSQAQETKRVIEQTIGDRTYVYVCYDETSSVTIYNKKNHINTIEDLYCEYYRAEKIDPFDTIFDKLFSEERQKELKGKTLSMDYYCDTLGNVLEIKFILRDISMITLDEVYALESTLLKYKLKISTTCPEKKYYNFMSAYRWK